jgi:hypothetical protein
VYDLKVHTKWRQPDLAPPYKPLEKEAHVHSHAWTRDGVPFRQPKVCRQEYLYMGSMIRSTFSRTVLYSKNHARHYATGHLPRVLSSALFLGFDKRAKIIPNHQNLYPRMFLAFLQKHLRWIQTTHVCYDRDRLILLHMSALGPRVIAVHFFHLESESVLHAQSSRHSQYGAFVVLLCFRR